MRVCYIEEGNRVRYCGELIGIGFTREEAIEQASEYMRNRFMDRYYELIDMETAQVEEVPLNWTG